MIPRNDCGESDFYPYEAEELENGDRLYFLDLTEVDLDSMSVVNKGQYMSIVIPAQAEQEPFNVRYRRKRGASKFGRNRFFCEHLVADLVLKANCKGYRTVRSCSGHSYKKFGISGWFATKTFIQIIEPFDLVEDNVGKAIKDAIMGISYVELAERLCSYREVAYVGEDKKLCTIHTIFVNDVKANSIEDCINIRYPETFNDLVRFRGSKFLLYDMGLLSEKHESKRNAELQIQVNCILLNKFVENLVAISDRSLPEFDQETIQKGVQSLSTYL